MCSRHPASRYTTAALFALALGLLSPYLVEAQVPPDSVRQLLPADSTSPGAVPSVVRRLPSPGGAFLRSVLLPGWGQAAYGAYFRGGVYFAADAGSWFMLLKTMSKLGEAKELQKWQMGAVRDSLMAAIAADPLLAEQYRSRPGGLELAVTDAVAEHPRVVGSGHLVDSRKKQREDWIALTLFWMLASGVDAFVNAHLSDFPARINAEAQPDGRVDLGVRIPVGGGQ